MILQLMVLVYVRIVIDFPYPASQLLQPGTMSLDKAPQRIRIAEGVMR